MRDFANCGAAFIHPLHFSRPSTMSYIRYYSGHKGKFGHEFMEFEFRPDGRLRYANNSNYKNDVMIRKEGESPGSRATS